MSDMIPALRRQKILDLVKNEGLVSINRLAENFGVSHMTIRRDVQKLEEEGLVIQVSGGVQSRRWLNTEPSHVMKTAMAGPEKARIGAKAAALIPLNVCVYLDAGTTSLALAQHLRDRDDLTIVTNDFAVLEYLMSANCEADLIHTGGLVRKSNCSSVGHLAANTLSALSIDICFISASSWDIRGVTTPDREKVLVKQAAAAAGSRKILICDSSKYGQYATYLALKLNDLDVIVCDKALPDHAKQSIVKAGIELILV